MEAEQDSGCQIGISCNELFGIAKHLDEMETDMDSHSIMNRRDFSAMLCGATVAACVPKSVFAERDKKDFRLKYILSSAMYGDGELADIVPEVSKAGAGAIDIWPKVHGTQREQIEEMGHDKFAALLKQNKVKLGGIACYRLGPFGLQNEMRIASKIGGRGVVLVCGARGPKGVTGDRLRAALKKFIEQLKPHVAVAEETGCVIAVENHSNSLVESPDSIRWFGEFAKSDHLGIAFAPHHLPQDAKLIGKIADDLGEKTKFVYAQQHGMGSSKKLPKKQEMLQMPGRGPLDFTPLLATLKSNNYQGYTEIFMHPVPRGVPILDSTGAITAEINRSRTYLESCLAKLSS